MIVVILFIILIALHCISIHDDVNSSQSLLPMYVITDVTSKSV